VKLAVPRDRLVHADVVTLTTDGTVVVARLRTTSKVEAVDRLSFIVDETMAVRLFETEATRIVLRSGPE